MEKIWLKNYDPRVPVDIDPDRYSSIVDIFEQSIAKYSSNVSYINMGKSITFAELDSLSRDFAAYLQSSGLKKGDAVAIMMPNLIQYPVALFGILRAGMTVVNVNPLYTPRELQHQLSDSNSKAIVVIENIACTLSDVIKNTGIETVLLTSLGDMLSPLRKVFTNFAAKYVKKMIPAFDLPNAVRFLDALKQGNKQSYERPEITGDALAFLQYTGGTTGVSKGAMLTHRNIVANLEQTSTILENVIEPG
ncbi:MAG: long-chain acyl-CoA synthetase, partial [Glaciecola sp.]